MSDYTVELLNSIRNSASAEYAARVPAVTVANIAEIGNAITTYEVTYNEFTNILINKIALTLFSSKIAKNKLAPFKKGFLPFGKTVEEIHVEMAEAEGHWIERDEDHTNKDGIALAGSAAIGATAFSRKKPDVKVMYHSQNREDYYKATVSKAQVKLAFRSANGVQELLSRIVNSIYSGSYYDEYVIMKNILGQYKENYKDYAVAAITDAATAQAFIRTVRKAVADMSFVSTAYNKAAVKQWCAPEEAALLVNKDVIAHTDVDVLAKAFNLGKTDFEPTIVVVDDFGTMENTYGLLIDKGFFMVWDTLLDVEQQRNAQGLFTNYFYHVHQIHSLSEFKNAVRFTTDLELGE